MAFSSTGNPRASMSQPTSTGMSALGARPSIRQVSQGVNKPTLGSKQQTAEGAQWSRVVPQTGAAAGATTQPGFAQQGTPGGAAPGAVTTPGGAQGGNPIDTLYQDILAGHEGSWADKQKMLQGQMAAYQRQAAAIGGSMGRSVAGGWGGMMSQAWGKGMNEMTQARQAHDDKTRSLQLAYMDNMTNRSERQKDRDLDAAMKQSELAAQYGGQDANGVAWQSFENYKNKYGDIDPATEQKIRDLFAAGRGEDAQALIQQLWASKIQ